MFGIRSQVWQKRNPAKRRKLLLDLDGFEVHEDLWSLYIAPGLKKPGEGEDDGGKQPGMKKRNGERQKQEESLKNNWVVGIDLYYVRLIFDDPEPEHVFLIHPIHADS